MWPSGARPVRGIGADGSRRRHGDATIRAACRVAAGRCWAGAGRAGAGLARSELQVGLERIAGEELVAQVLGRVRKPGLEEGEAIQDV